MKIMWLLRRQLYKNAATVSTQWIQEQQFLPVGVLFDPLEGPLFILEVEENPVRELSAGWRVTDKKKKEKKKEKKVILVI